MRLIWSIAIVVLLPSAVVAQDRCATPECLGRAAEVEARCFTLPARDQQPCLAALRPIRQCTEKSTPEEQLQCLDDLVEEVKKAEPDLKDGELNWPMIPRKGW